MNPARTATDTDQVHAVGIQTLMRSEHQTVADTIEGNITLALFYPPGQRDLLVGR